MSQAVRYRQSMMKLCFKRFVFTHKSQTIELKLESGDLYFGTELFYLLIKVDMVTF